MSHSQAPQKPVRRKYNPESQNLETVPPHVAMIPPPLKTAQKSVKNTLQLINVDLMRCIYPNK